MENGMIVNLPKGFIWGRDITKRLRPYKTSDDRFGEIVKGSNLKAYQKRQISANLGISVDEITKNTFIQFTNTFFQTFYYQCN